MGLLSSWVGVGEMTRKHVYLPLTSQAYSLGLILGMMFRPWWQSQQVLPRTLSLDVWPPGHG